MQGLALHGFHVFLSFIGNFVYIDGDFVSALSLHLARKPTRMEAMKNGDNFLLTNILYLKSLVQCLMHKTYFIAIN